MFDASFNRINDYAYNFYFICLLNDNHFFLIIFGKKVFNPLANNKNKITKQINFFYISLFWKHM